MAVGAGGTMMSPNCSSSLRRPRVFTVTWKAAVESAPATAPAATWTFLFAYRGDHLARRQPRAAIRSGSSHRRMLYSPAPHTTTSLIPGRRSSSSRTWR